MGSSRGRGLLAVACLLGLSGCATSTKLGDFFPKSGEQTALTDQASAVEPTPTGSIGEPAGPAGLLGSNPSEDVALGRKQYRAGNFGIA